MAKIKIYFNNKNYNVDESDFSVASADLQSHLSNVMNGSGAMINFKGTSYNIDSTKLQNATNDFISYLRTVAGNGHKIKIGGVEYSIDSTKLANAISELEAVLRNLGSDNKDGLNEYGFYFNREYRYLFNEYPDTGKVYMSVWLYEDGSSKTVIHSEHTGVINETINEPNSLIYSYMKIASSENEDWATFSNNGKTAIVKEIVNKGKEDEYIEYLEFILVEEESVDNGLNEYGFYFDKQYAYTSDVNGVGTFIFHEDGSAEMYINGALQVQVPAGLVIYEKNKASSEAVGVTVIFTNNGKNFTVEGQPEVYTVISEEYCGYYFGKKYTHINDEGVKETFIFYEDGYAERYENDILTMTTKSENVVPCYGKNIVYFRDPESSNFVGIPFENNGTRAVLGIGSEPPAYYDLEVENNNDGLNEYGFYFDRKYAFEPYDNNYSYIIFYSNGTMENGYGHGNTVAYKYYLNSICNLNGYRELDVYDNGTVLKTSNDMSFVLEDTPKTEMNEYGFYFDEWYVLAEEYEQNGVVTKNFTKRKFYEDGTYQYLGYSVYSNVTYSENEASVFDGYETNIYIFSSNGTEVDDPWENHYTLVE